MQVSRTGLCIAVCSTKGTRCSHRWRHGVHQSKRDHHVLLAVNTRHVTFQYMIIDCFFTGMILVSSRLLHDAVECLFMMCSQRCLHEYTSQISATQACISIPYFLQPKLYSNVPLCGVYIVLLLRAMPPV